MSATNPVLRSTAVMLERASKKNKAPIWLTAAKLLSSPATTKVEINVGRISRLSAGGSKILVPGKVLGSGTIDKKVVIGAFAFSESARAKIEASGGSAFSIDQLMKKYPDGSGVKIVR